MSFVPPDISENDRAKVQEVRESLKELLGKVPSFDTDFNLLRWLQGWDYKTAQMLPVLRDHLRFHICWDLDNILVEKPNEICRQHYPFGLFPTPIAEGSNIYLFIEVLGLLDSEGLFRSVRLIEILRGNEITLVGLCKIENKFVFLL